MPLVETESLEPGIALIALNRPERKNAINFELVGELHAALDAVAADQHCKVVILTGRGTAFCSGLDLKSWGTLPDIGTDPYRNAGSTGQSYLSSLVAHVRRTPQIVIASINGAAFGGGLALSLACDLRFASASATLCAAFIRTGLTATDVGISYFLPRLIGAARAFDLMVTGRTIDGATAERMGIVSQVHGDDELMAADAGDGPHDRCLHRRGSPTDQAGDVGQPRRAQSGVVPRSRRSQPGPGRCLGRGPGVHGELPVTLFRQGVTAGGLSGQGRHRRSVVVDDPFRPSVVGLPGR